MIDINVKKAFHTGKDKLLLDLNIKVKKGEFVTLYGKSGAGKTSTLRMLSGLLKPEEGTISVNGKEWFSSKKNINLKPQKRTIGYVFQDYALFPNMTVIENLEFALKKGQSNAIIEELISVIELQEFRNTKPELLSGGQQQRVALARALVQQPDILLLDEPLSALDSKIRNKLQDYILKIHKKYGLTTIMVSHDIDEILRLANTVIEIKNGTVVTNTSANNFFKDYYTELKGTITAIENNTFSVKIGDNIIEVDKNNTSYTIGEKVLIQFHKKRLSEYKIL